MFYAVVCIVSAVIFIAVLSLVPTRKALAEEKREVTETPPYNQMPRVVAASVVTLIFGAVTFFTSLIIVAPGEVRVVHLFGEMQEETYTEGPHLINPFFTEESMSERRLSEDFSGENRLEAISKDKVRLFVDATAPYILNPGMAWKMYQRYPEGWNLLTPAIRSAVRDAVPTMEWERSTSSEGRAELAEMITERIEQNVVNDLVQAGFTKEQAAATFTFPTIQLRRIEPREGRILAAIEEEQAATVDLRRQKTLTQIAREEAKRRENEGLGIKNMMDKLPSNFTVDEMVGIINANAAKANAEAFMKAVETGNPNINIVTGNTGQTPVAIPTK